MRLINVDKMVLEEFFGVTIPPYAILSHCWGQGEVTFQDIGGGPNWRLKPGFTKIDHACCQAKLDGHKYVWVDTCCIDKTSSAELSEAINSMFSWYADAIVCYVYMQDVDVLERPSADETCNQFQVSRWFSRGWTLQELVAPQEIEFYDKNWNMIGTKSKLFKILSRITKIPELILQYRSHLQSVGVAQRMSWAARRQTTRVEDIAYCLLGLFGVHMPLLYGEGGKAFIRLQEEILRVSDDQSLFAWDSAKDSPNFGVLARSPAAFQFAGDIVPIPSMSDIHLFSMTNKGLSIRLPLLARGSEVIGLLDCRLKGDFSSIVGIPLLQTSNPSVFERNPLGKLEHCSPDQVAAVRSHTIYIRGNQSLNAPWDFYKTFILRTVYGYDQNQDYIFCKAGSILSEWEVNTNMVRTAWNRELNRCRLAFGLYDKKNGHTWLVMLIVHTKRDGTFRHWHTATVFLQDRHAVNEWDKEHFSDPSHFCLGCWCSSKDHGMRVNFIEQVVLNQNVIVVDVQMPIEGAIPHVRIPKQVPDSSKILQ